MKERYEKLESLRLEKNLSYQDMADRLGLSKCFYWQIEHKQRNLYYDMAKKIADILGVKPDDLFFDEF